jgi:transposase
MIDKTMAPPVAEARMIEAEAVRRLRQLQARGWGSKRIARELGLARNTVRRYLRGGPVAEKQVRPSARALDESGRASAIALFDGEAEGNAVVITELLRERGYDVALRTVQKLTSWRRREHVAAAVASVRFETPPGAQMQIDFGQKRVWIAESLVRVHLLVAVLSYSRRIFVKAFLAERQDDWREGIVGAFRHFGGVPRTMLGDNARALVLEHCRATQTVTFHPAYLAFCRDWDVVPRACAPYHARTKGKTESGVKYVKRNALAGRHFESFAALETHLAAWMKRADARKHGTTHEAPMARFVRDEAAALRPLPAMPMPARERRLERRVANDALVDVDTVRYSVPHRFVRDRVAVLVSEHEVRIFHGEILVATHRRAFEPHAIVREPDHYEGLWRRSDDSSTHTTTAVSPLVTLGRSLDDYAAVIEVAS